MPVIAGKSPDMRGIVGAAGVGVPSSVDQSQAKLSSDLVAERWLTKRKGGVAPPTLLRFRLRLRRQQIAFKDEFKLAAVGPDLDALNSAPAADTE